MKRSFSWLAAAAAVVLIAGAGPLAFAGAVPACSIPAFGPPPVTTGH